MPPWEKYKKQESSGAPWEKFVGFEPTETKEEQFKRITQDPLLFRSEEGSRGLDYMDSKGAAAKGAATAAGLLGGGGLLKGALGPILADSIATESTGGLVAGETIPGLITKSKPVVKKIAKRLANKAIEGAGIALGGKTLWDILK